LAKLPANCLWTKEIYNDDEIAIDTTVIISAFDETLLFVSSCPGRAENSIRKSPID
jgi:hypothetical protein